MLSGPTPIGIDAIDLDGLRPNIDYVGLKWIERIDELLVAKLKG